MFMIAASATNITTIHDLQIEQFSTT